MLRTLIAAAALSALAIATVAVAQEPTPTSPAPPAPPVGGSDIVTVGPGILPCVGMPQTHGFAEDAALTITEFRAVVRTVPGEYQELVDEVTLAWTPPAESTGLMCLSLKRSQPDGTYPGFTDVYPFLGTHHTLQPMVWGVVDGRPAPGFEEACWQLQAIAEDRVGPAVEVCAKIAHPPGPRPPQSEPTPSGTPWPAPSPIQMRNSYEPDGSGAPITLVDLRWFGLEGFTGAYEVERAIPSELFRPSDAEFAPAATVSASEASDGWLSFKEEVDYLTMWTSPPCYRVRAVINAETGPYSEVRCAVLPPGLSPPASLRPPDAGTGQGATRDRDLAELVWVAGTVSLLAAGALALAAVALRPRR